MLELLLTGGIRSAKTENAVKRVMSSFCYTERSRVWGLHETEKTSKLIHQRRFYKFIPPEMKPKDSTGMETGKGRRTIGSNFSYTEATGFPPNLFLLYWKCFDEHDRPFRGGGLVDFQFYKSDDSTKQGEELTVATSDELVPKSTCETVRQRLLTRAQDTRNPVFLERIRQAIRVLESGRALPPALRGLIYHSVHIITFTPKEGYSPTVAEFLDGATTIKETTTHVVPPGALGLPEDWKQQMLAKGNPELLPGKTVPLFKQPRKSTRLVCYLHTWMNPFGGNWPGLVEDCAGRSDEYIRIHAYGDVQKNWNVQFANAWDNKVHIVHDLAKVPRHGTWRLIVDPHKKRPYFMAFQLTDERNNRWYMQQWPQAGMKIPGVGDPGEWAVSSETGKRNGDKGPAQKIQLAWGYAQYTREIWRQRMLIGEWWVKDRKNPPPERTITWSDFPDWTMTGRPIDLYECIADSRYAATAEQMATGEMDWFQWMSEQENSIPFEAAPGNKLDEGDKSIIAGLTDYNPKQPVDTLNCPGIRVWHECEGIIFAMQNFSYDEFRDKTLAADEACKEGRDVMAMGELINPKHVPPASRKIHGGGHF